MSKEYDEKQLRRILEPFVNAFLSNLECDGVTRVISFLLNKLGVSFSVYVGTIKYKDKCFFPHFWIETEKGTIFDFTAQKWLGVTWRKAEYQKEEEVNVAQFIPSPATLGALLW